MRVFVLGAGAFVHAGYPLASQLGKRLTTRISALPAQHEYHSYLQQIVELYGGLDDFESVLSDLMTARPGSPARTLPQGYLPQLLPLTRPALLGSAGEWNRRMHACSMFSCRCHHLFELEQRPKARLLEMVIHR